jgi:hypothetical protein
MTLYDADGNACLWLRDLTLVPPDQLFEIEAGA